jgi:hypothetical protein
MCVVGFSAFSSSEGNYDYSARLIQYGVLKKVPNCVFVCAVVLSGSCVFLKLCEHYKVRITECLPCSLGELNSGLYVRGV